MSKKKKQFEKREPVKCCVCGTPLRSDNTGGADAKGFYCKSDTPDRLRLK